MTTRQARSTAPASTTGSAVPAWWGLVLGIVAVRAGAMLGLWPLVVGSDGGVERSNVLALVVHGLGAVAAVGFLLARSKPGSILGLAYTGYSTIALGLNNPRPGLTVIIWVIGVAAMAALLVALIRGGLSAPVRPQRSAVALTGAGMALGAALATAIALLRV